MFAQLQPNGRLDRPNSLRVWPVFVLLSALPTCHTFGILPSQPFSSTATSVHGNDFWTNRVSHCIRRRYFSDCAGVHRDVDRCTAFVGRGGGWTKIGVTGSTRLLSHEMRNGVVALAHETAGAEESGRVRPRRKPRGNNLRRDEAGVPSEKVYAPRVSQYGKPTVGGSGRSKRVRPQGEDREVSINNAARLKVAGGSVKGRRLESPDVFLRPMMGKVKEALFNTLIGFGVFETGDARFLDLFSGSGSVGIEALSRGAGQTTFVDLAKDCCEVSLRNANICGFDDKAKAVRGDVMDVLYNPRKYGLETPFDVVTVTPPYEEVVYGDLIKALAESDLVVQDTIVVIEYPVELGCLPHAIGDSTMVGLRNRRYGRTVLGVWVYLPSGQHGDMLDSRPEEFVAVGKKA